MTQDITDDIENGFNNCETEEEKEEFLAYVVNFAMSLKQEQQDKVGL